MRYYKTFGDVLKSEFEKAGLKDDKGKEITSTDKGMTEKDYVAHRKEQLRRKLNNLRIRINLRRL